MYASFAKCMNCMKQLIWRIHRVGLSIVFHFWQIVTRKSFKEWVIIFFVFMCDRMQMKENFPTAVSFSVVQGIFINLFFWNAFLLISQCISLRIIFDEGSRCFSNIYGKYQWWLIFVHLFILDIYETLSVWNRMRVKNIYDIYDGIFRRLSKFHQITSTYPVLCDWSLE